MSKNVAANNGDYDAYQDEINKNKVENLLNSRSITICTYFLQQKIKPALVQN